MVALTDETGTCEAVVPLHVIRRSESEKKADEKLRNVSAIKRGKQEEEQREGGYSEKRRKREEKEGVKRARRKK